MHFKPIIRTDQTGQQIVLRHAEASDAEDLLRYLKTIAAETPFLMMDPDEVTLTVEAEREYIRAKENAERELLLIALKNGKHIGNCALNAVGRYRRYRHRCSIAIALYREACGQGIGRIMLETVLAAAKTLEYEQAELEVIADNKRAVSLYESLGFVRCGILPDNVKYADGSRADAYIMMKKL